MNEPSESPPLLRQLTCRNLLSFAPNTAPLSLQNLNVLIGPNGSGKSNLLESVSLLRSTTTDPRHVISKGGGIAEWIWKGQPNQPASIEAVVSTPTRRHDLRHFVSFRSEQQNFKIDDERVENDEPDAGEAGPYFFYKFQGGKPVINVAGGDKRELSHETIESELSILAQRRDPDNYPELAQLSEAYDEIRLYREWAFGRSTVFRRPQQADLRTDRLEEDFSNLGLFLNRIRRKPQAKQAVLEGLRDLYEGLNDFDVSIEGGTVQVFFTEGDFVIPATRLSDGSVRFLCLLAILCDPEPPKVIGIEEPELGLHPDLLPKIADLLIDASDRCQLIVTTHSDILVDAMTEQPESVVVCEKHEGKTVMQRLDSRDVEAYLEQFRLGQLWTRGQIGGTRW